MGLITKHPVFLTGYYGKNLYMAQPQILIGYLAAKLPTFSAVPIISVANDVVTASAVFADKGIGDITRCGFYVNSSAECTDGGTYYDATVPGGLAFTAPLVDLGSGVSYIAAFAENTAGKAFSEFTMYRNSLGWEGGVINGISPDAIASFVIGNAAVSRAKINQVIVGGKAW